MIGKKLSSWLIQLISLVGISVSSCYAADSVDLGATTRRSAAPSASSPGLFSQWTLREREYISQTQPTPLPVPNTESKTKSETEPKETTEPKENTESKETESKKIETEPESSIPKASIQDAQPRLHTLVTHPVREKHETEIGCTKNQTPQRPVGLKSSSFSEASIQNNTMGQLSPPHPHLLAAETTPPAPVSPTEPTPSSTTQEPLPAQEAPAEMPSAEIPSEPEKAPTPENQKQKPLADAEEIPPKRTPDAQKLPEETLPVPAPEPIQESVEKQLHKQQKEEPSPTSTQTSSPNLSDAKIRSFQKSESSTLSKQQLPKVGIPSSQIAPKRSSFQQGSNDARLSEEIAQNFVRAPETPLPFRYPENPIAAEITPSPQEALPKSSAATVPTQPASPQTPQVIGSVPPVPEEAFINFNDVSIIQYLSFISKLTQKNFVFDKADLDFNVTIISTKPTTLDNVMATLLQELRVHNLSLMEVGNNLIIHRNETANSPGSVVGHEEKIPKDHDYITKVFLIENTPPQNLIDILHPLLSSLAIVESNPATNHLIITDIAPNIEKVSQIIDKLDKPFTGSEVGQYVIQNESVENVVQLLKQLMEAIAGDTPITIVPQTSTNSIFVVSSAHLVEKAMAILKRIDATAGETRILSIQNLRKEEAPGRVQLSKNLQDLLQVLLSNLSKEELERLGLHGFDNLKLPGSPEEQAALLRYLRSLSDEERRRLLDGYALKASSKPQERKDEDYLTPAERRYLDQASKAQRFEFGKGRGKLLEEEGFFNGMEELGAVPGKEETRQGQWQAAKPSAHLDSTEFIVIRLLNRKGSEIVSALTSLAEKLNAPIQGTEKQQPTELLQAINSIQLLESSNSLLVTGTPRSLTKVRDLIYQIDIPVRQVLVEMLIIRTSLNDSLSYGVDLGARAGGGDTESGFQSTPTQDLTLNGQLNGIAGSTSGLIPNFFRGNIFNLGVIGRNLHHGGLTFNTLGALVTALHTDNRVQVVLNPKIVVEDNSMAEVFVGINTAYTTETITSSQNNQISQNVEYRDVGTSLKVTPRIRQNDVITLEIEQEISDEVVNQTNNNSSSGQVQQTASSSTAAVTNVGPTTNKSKTKTVVHVPNEYFLILSGMLQKQESQINTQVPCLGGVPFIGGLFKSRGNQDSNSNIMIFIRPSIIEGQNMHTETKRQQDIFREKTRNRHRGEYETEEALDYLNIRETYDWAQE